MKRISVFIAIYLLMTIGVYSQDKEYKSLIDSFVTEYNAGAYDTIYGQFAPSLQQELPLSDAKLFFEDMKAKLGGINNMTFYGLDNNQLPLFRAEFENEEIALINLATNEFGELVGLRLLDLPAPVDESFKTMSLEEIIVNETVNMPNKGQFAIAVLDQGQVAYYGFKKLGNGVRAEANEDLKFSTANLMTIFTSTILANAAVEKKIEITANVNDYYDFPFNKGIELPFVALSNHSGLVQILPEFKNVNDKQLDDYLTKFDRTQLEAYLATNLQTDSVKDRRQSFSFLGYAILGNTLSKVYDQPFEKLLKDKVFTKYGMLDSSAYMPKKKKGVVKGINAYEQEMYPVRIGALLPSSGGISTVKDLSRFVKAQFNPDDEVVKLTHKPTLIINAGYWSSLGWKIGQPLSSKDPLYFTRGIDAGYSNYIAFDPIGEKGIIILSNSSSEAALKALDALSYKLLAKIFDTK